MRTIQADRTKLGLSEGAVEVLSWELGLGTGVYCFAHVNWDVTGYQGLFLSLKQALL